jgi:hypothetical protein
METQNVEMQGIKNEILKYYSNLNEQNLLKLVELTNKQNIGFVSVKGYSSELSKGTEIANQLINVGMIYKNAIEKDNVTLANIDLSTIDVNKFDYRYINTDGLTIDKFKQAVKDSLPLALEELKQPKAPRKSNDVYINKMLVFNTNTLKLSIIGKSEAKTIETEGTFKVVKSAPKTIAKKLIEKQMQGKTQALRRFAIDNFIGSIKLQGKTIEIE